MAPPIPTYITCPTCGNGWFMQARRIYTLEYAGGDLSRNWSNTENSSVEIVCDKDGTRLRWNPSHQTFEQVT